PRLSRRPLLSRPRPHRHLHSFPTRRSSDLRDSPGGIASSRRALEIAERLAAAPGSNTADRRNLGSVYVALGWQIARANEIERGLDRKSTRLNSSHDQISYAVFCLKKKKKNK